MQGTCPPIILQFYITHVTFLSPSLLKGWLRPCVHVHLLWCAMMTERLCIAIWQAWVPERVTWATAALCFFMSSFMSSWSSSMRDCRSFFSLCNRLSCSSSYTEIKQRHKTNTNTTEINTNSEKWKTINLIEMLYVLAGHKFMHQELFGCQNVFLAIFVDTDSSK